MRDEAIHAAQRRCTLRRQSPMPRRCAFGDAFVHLASADDFAFGRRIFQDKAQCVFCHGWAGDGAGAPQSSGGAANLRETKLNREQLIEVISCGRPGQAMPRFDDQAYAEKRCYGGITEAALGQDLPPLPPGIAAAAPGNRGAGRLPASQDHQPRPDHARRMSRSLWRARRAQLRAISRASLTAATANGQGLR